MVLSGIWGIGQRTILLLTGPKCVVQVRRYGHQMNHVISSCGDQCGHGAPPE